MIHVLTPTVMANAIIPRQQGDDYQARLFWLEAIRLLQHRTKVLRVGFDVEQPKGFDDIAVFYENRITDDCGYKHDADYHQVKFHVDRDGAFRVDALIDPSFINATKFSLLQRLRDARQSRLLAGEHPRFFVVAPWGVDTDDPLAKLISNVGGEIRLKVLAEGGANSLMGRTRKIWREHLELSSDEDLFEILRCLRIHCNAPTLERLRKQVDAALLSVGFARIEDGLAIYPYDDLARKLRGRGSSLFTRESLLAECKREGLWVGAPGSAVSGVLELGIRSYMRWAEHMEDETDRMLCLTSLFEGRHPQNPAVWDHDVRVKMRRFLDDLIRPGRRYHLHLDVHSSIALAAGYCVEVKRGVDVVPVQRSASGRVVWLHDGAERANKECWSVDDVTISTSKVDVAIALSVTHEIRRDVELYVRLNLPEVGRILFMSVLPTPGPTSVGDGLHAWMLAEQVCSIIREKRNPQERTGSLHVFAAAPNGLMFFLGRMALGLGRLKTYEFDFEKNEAGNYRPALTLAPEEFR